MSASVARQLGMGDPTAPSRGGARRRREKELLVQRVGISAPTVSTPDLRRPDPAIDLSVTSLGPARNLYDDAAIQAFGRDGQWCSCPTKLNGDVW